MAKPIQTVHIRLPHDLHSKLVSFHNRSFAGLPLSLILRLLIIDQLQKSDEDLMRIVLEHIKGKPEGAKHGTNRIGADPRKSNSGH